MKFWIRIARYDSNAQQGERQKGLALSNKTQHTNVHGATWCNLVQPIMITEESGQRWASHSATQMVIEVSREGGRGRESNYATELVIGGARDRGDHTVLPK